MIREGLRDFEARLAIAERILSMPEEKRKPYRDLLDDFPWRSAA